MKKKFISDKTYPCDICCQTVPAYYILSRIAKQLWVQCPHCGTHARPYIADLDLPYKPSKSYLQASPDKQPASTPLGTTQQQCMF